MSFSNRNIKLFKSFVTISYCSAVFSRYVMLIRYAMLTYVMLNFVAYVQLQENV